MKTGSTTLDTHVITQSGQTSSGGGGGCVAPNVMILMADGTTKKAGLLAVGDEIKTQQETSLEWVNARVYEKKSLHSGRIKVFAGDKEIVVSPNHRFYVDNKNEYIAANLLEEGDILSGNEFIKYEDYSDGEVLKISVENAFTYVSNDILSHNAKLDFAQQE